MAVHLTDAVTGAIASSADYNADHVEIEATWSAQGNFVVTGLVPSAGTGLSVNVTAGTALVTGYISFSSFVISGLSNGTVNHLYILQNGTGSSNTTGTAPANSAKLGTATTSGGVVTSVNILRSSGRQLLVRGENMVPGAAGSPGSLNLASWNATAGDTFQFFGTLPSGAVPAVAAPLTLTIDDTPNNTAKYPLRLRHTVSSGAGANNLGVGLQFELENDASGISTAGTLAMIAENAGSVNFTTRYEFALYNNTNLRTQMTVGPDDVRIEVSPKASANNALLAVGSGGFAGGAGNFAGHASGTLLGLNMDPGWAGSWIDVQSDSASYFQVASSGATTHTVWDSSTNVVSTALTLRHLANTGAGAANIGTRLEWQAETSTNDTANIAGQIDCVLTTATAGAAVSRMDLRVNNAGSIVNPLFLTPTQAAFNVALQGNGQGLAYARASITYTLDSDKTLSSSEYVCPIIDITTDAVLTTGRNLIFPGTSGGLWYIINRNAQTITAKTSGGTGIAVGPGRARWVALPTGVNMFALTANVDYTGAPTAYSESNVTTDRAFDANATTLDEVADVLGTLIKDLRAAGIVG